MSRKSILALTALAALSTSCLVSGAVFAALPSDCVQSNYPVRVIPACTEILRGNPINAVAWFKRGKAYLDQRIDTRDLGLAITDLTKAIEIDPKYADAYQVRGVAFRRNGDFPRAIADQSKAIEINPGFAVAYGARGYAYQQRATAIARADYDKAIELDPAIVLAYFDRAFLHALNGDTNRAVDDLKRAFEFGGTAFDDAFETLGPNQRNQVVALFTRAIERGANDAVVFNGRGFVYASTDDQERAIADYSKAIEIDPMYVDAYVSRGKAYGSKSFDDPRALADYNKAIELDPRNAYAYLARGMHYAEDQLPNRPDLAIADYNKAIELDPTKHYAYLRRGMLHEIDGQHALARADFAKVLELEWKFWLLIKTINPNYLDEIEAERQARPQ